MKNLRIVFDNIIGDCLIPNAMPDDLTNSMIEYVETNNECHERNFREKFTEKNNGITYPYANNWDQGFTTKNCDVLSELQEDEDYVTADGVIYLYLIGTAGNINYGLNPTEINSEGIIKSSYFENLSDKVLHYLKNQKNFFIWFRQQQEAINYETIEQIYIQATKLSIPLEKIVLQSDCANYNEMKIQFEKTYNTELKLKHKYYPWSLGLGAEYIKELTEKNNIVKEIIKNRKNKVICLNKRLKDYRVAIISYLLGMKYDGMYLSYNNKFLMANDIDAFKSEKNKDILNEGYKIFQNTKIRKADNIDDDFDMVYWDDYKMYEDSYFSIVTESNWYLPLRLTEKITKPIINLHPFVLLGPPKSLELLKFYGFKTFSDFWDESYDDIENFSERFDAITKVIDYLINLTVEEWDILTEKIKPILIYNRKHLKSFDYNNTNKIYIQNFNKLLENQLSNKYNSILCSE